jgi:hypothetical protein
MVEYTMERAKYGCFSVLTLLGGGIAGFYYGLANAKGQQVDKNLEAVLLCAPTIIGGRVGYMNAEYNLNDPQVRMEAQRQLDKKAEELRGRIPDYAIENAKSNAQQLVSNPANHAIFLGIVNAAVTGAGYFIGHLVGKNS